MSVLRKENGSLVKKAGRALVDLALSLTSNNAVANSAVTGELNQKVTKFSGTDSGNTYVTVDQIAYDETNKKLGLKVDGADTVIPFSSGIPWLVTCSQYYTTSDGWYGNLRFDKIGQSGAVGRYVVATNMTTATISGIMSLKYNSPSNVTLTPLVNMKMITVNTGGTTTGANVPTVQNLTANTPITVDYNTPFTIFIPR